MTTTGSVFSTVPKAISAVAGDGDAFEPISAMIPPLLHVFDDAKVVYVVWWEMQSNVPWEVHVLQPCAMPFISIASCDEHNVARLLVVLCVVLCVGPATRVERQNCRGLMPRGGAYCCSGSNKRQGPWGPRVRAMLGPEVGAVDLYQRRRWVVYHRRCLRASQRRR